MGYARDDGRAGTRNYIAVVAASNCAAHTAEWIASSYDKASLPAESMEWSRSRMATDADNRPAPIWRSSGALLAGVLDHPNVSAAIILGLGCEVNQIDHYLGAGRRAPTA